MPTKTKHLGAIFAGIAVFLFALPGLFFATVAVIWALLRRGASPDDYSVGDSVAWAMLLISPVALPVMIAVSALGGFFVYLFVTAKSRSR